MQRGTVLATVILLLVNIANITDPISYTPPESISLDDSLIAERSCSVLTCAIEEDVLFGNNQDGLRGTPYIAFGNAVNWNIGGLWVFDEPICYSGYMTSEGKPTSTEASMNQDGLCVAVNGLPPIPMYIDPSKENYTVGSGAGGPIHECGSVDEVISFYEQYNYMPDGNNPVWGVQLQYADASGNAVVVGGDENGNITFTHKNESAFIVSTNHNLAVPDNYYPGHYLESHERFETATQMLEDIDTYDNLSVEAIRDILDAIHSENPYDPLMETSHSFIFNPKTLDIYVYYRHDYTRVFIFNLLDEIATLEVDETRIYNLTELYENWEDETLGFLERYSLILVLGVSGAVVLAVSIVILFQKRRRS
ncbi:MAG: carcinine hydrolase/isopenicillin-N N-acyltransferase family protein [Candidatus Thorarchaeota archaeon]